MTLIWIQAVILVLLAAGCAGPRARQGEPTRVVVGNEKPSDRCKYLGETRTHPETFPGHSAARPVDETGALLDTKSEAAKLGGNYVYRGSVFQCPDVELRLYEPKGRN